MSTKIQWTDETWNPTTGCTKIAAGCLNCYAKTMTRRLKAMGNLKYAAGFDTVVCHPDELERPLRWRKPRLVFVNSMSDLFHKDVPFEFIDRVFIVMCLTVQHTYQVLTKRPERMLKWFQTLGDRLPTWLGNDECPMDHIHLGVSVSTQADANRNIPILLQCPAAKRFVSMEPLLEEITIPTRYWRTGARLTDTSGVRRDIGQRSPGVTDVLIEDGMIDQLILGGESGPGARPIRPDWVRAARDQCVAAGVPFFFKGWGRERPGRELDGKVWSQMPECEEGSMTKESPNHKS